jgi:hypothetical protein
LPGSGAPRPRAFPGQVVPHTRLGRGRGVRGFEAAGEPGGPRRRGRAPSEGCASPAGSGRRRRVAWSVLVRPHGRDDRLAPAAGPADRLGACRPWPGSRQPRPACPPPGDRALGQEDLLVLALGVTAQIPAVIPVGPAARPGRGAVVLVPLQGPGPPSPGRSASPVGPCRPRPRVGGRGARPAPRPGTGRHGRLAPPPPAGPVRPRAGTIASTPPSPRGRPGRRRRPPQCRPKRVDERRELPPAAREPDLLTPVRPALACAGCGRLPGCRPGERVGRPHGFPVRPRRRRGRGDVVRPRGTGWACRGPRYPDPRGNLTVPGASSVNAGAGAVLPAPSARAGRGFLGADHYQGGEPPPRRNDRRHGGSVPGGLGPGRRGPAAPRRGPGGRPCANGAWPAAPAVASGEAACRHRRLATPRLRGGT